MGKGTPRSKLVRDAIRHGKPIICYWCSTGLNRSSCTADHLIPISKGGGNDLANLVISCYRCNMVRGNGLEAPNLSAWEARREAKRHRQWVLRMMIRRHEQFFSFGMARET